jgi:hypothetical protein
LFLALAPLAKGSRHLFLARKLCLAGGIVGGGILIQRASERR